MLKIILSTLISVFVSIYYFFPYANRNVDYLRNDKNNKFYLPENYGVDFSFPIHHAINNGTKMGKLYAQHITGCYEKYSQVLCDNSENSRMTMNRKQPSTQRNYSEIGFKKMKAPEELFFQLRQFWNDSHEHIIIEESSAGSTISNHWDSQSYLLPLHNEKYQSDSFSKTIFYVLKPILEEWVGRKLKETSLYGIRVYKENAILATHVDRLPLVTSCIIQVAQDIEEPWPLEVYSHDGKAYNITMEPGEMVLYESHTVLHGRPFPLKGKFYANLFVHFVPIDEEFIEDANTEQQELEGDDRIDAFQKEESHINEQDNNLVGQNLELVGNMMDEDQSLGEVVVVEHSDDDYLNSNDQKEPEIDKNDNPESTINDIFDHQSSDNLAVDRNDNDDATNENDEINNDEQQEDLSTSHKPVRTELHAAAADGNINRVIEIVEVNQHLVHVRDENGWQPIHEAARAGHDEVIDILINHGADINSKTNVGGTPLWWARYGNSHRVVEYLESLGASDGANDEL